MCLLQSSLSISTVNNPSEPQQCRRAERRSPEKEDHGGKAFSMRSSDSQDRARAACPTALWPPAPPETAWVKGSGTQTPPGPPRRLPPPGPPALATALPPPALIPTMRSAYNRSQEWEKARPPSGRASWGRGTGPWEGKASARGARSSRPHPEGRPGTRCRPCLRAPRLTGRALGRGTRSPASLPSSPGYH